MIENDIKVAIEADGRMLLIEYMDGLDTPTGTGFCVSWQDSGEDIAFLSIDDADILAQVLAQMVAADRQARAMH